MVVEISRENLKKKVFMLLLKIWNYVSSVEIGDILIEEITILWVSLY